MANYVLPQVLVFQEFEAAPLAADQPMRACIVGEQFSLHRYSDASEKASIRVSDSYDPSDEQCFAWPGRPAGSVVDETYTKVFMDDALLKYFHDPAGDGSVTTWVSPGKNRIRSQGKIFQTANGFTRSAELLRDVKVGDAIKLMASSCAEPITFNSTVVGLVADTIAAIVGSATDDTDNQGALSAAASGSQTAGAVNTVEIATVDGSTYDGLGAGNPSETYVVEVIGGGTGGDAQTAILKVTSASGNDNQAAVTPSAFGVATPIGTRGLEVTFDTSGVSSSSSGGGVDPDDFVLGQKWTIEVQQDFTPPVPTSGGSYAGAQNTTYIVTVTRGALFAASTKPQITVSTTTGIDLSGPTTVPASGSAVAIGTQGVTIEFAGTEMNTGDRYYVEVTAAAPGAVRTLVLANNLPDALRGECSSSSSSSSSGAVPDLDVTLYIKKAIEVSEDREGFAPLVNWTQSETEICIQAGIIAYDSEWASGGVEQPLDVEDGIIYVQHRDRMPTWCDTVGTISDISAVPSVLGTVDPDNPLAFGVAKALTNSNGEEVKFLGVCSSSPVTLDDWLLALDVLVGRDDVYSLVPLTQDKEVLDAFLAHCDAQSAPDKGRWRICWLNMAGVQTIGVYTELTDGDPILATITDDPDTSGTQYTLVEADGAEFLTAGVQAGDTVRALYTTDGFGNTTYSEFEIDAVINDETLRLVSGPSAPVNVPSKIEIWRTLSKTAFAESLAQNPGLFGNRRAYLIWPDTVGNAGVTFPGYFLCAGLAGLRSGVLPQQGLTNVEVAGFDDVSRASQFFSATQLDIMAASGYWIVTKDPQTGLVYTRQQLSTGDQADLNTKEQSITTNLDNISYRFLNQLKQFIGRGNVTPTMLQILSGEINSLLRELTNTVEIDRLGPQIINATILELAPHPTLRDRVVVRIDIELPFPLNVIELHLIA